MAMVTDMFVNFLELLLGETSLLIRHAPFCICIPFLQLPCALLRTLDLVCLGWTPLGFPYTDVCERFTDT